MEFLSVRAGTTPASHFNAAVWALLYMVAVEVVSLFLLEANLVNSPAHTVSKVYQALVLRLLKGAHKMVHYANLTTDWFRAAAKPAVVVTQVAKVFLP